LGIATISSHFPNDAGFSHPLLHLDAVGRQDTGNEGSCLVLLTAQFWVTVEMAADFN
jgi:hypothetical protein